MPDKPMEGVGASFRTDIKVTPTGHLCGALAAGIIIIGYIFGRKSPDDDITCPSELASELHRRFEEEMGTKMCAMLRPFQMKITADPDKDEKGHCGNTYAAGAKLAVEVILEAKELCPLCPEFEIPS
jgi:C_GCAxxG_C_C family probable redox protein